MAARISDIKGGSKLVQRRGKSKLLDSHVEQLGSTEKPVTSLTGNNDVNCWAPKSSTVFMTLLSTRYCSAFWSNISDCDETFNYWEPTHYLLYGSGFQTWEYSPKYAIRSYAYLLPHTLPGMWQKYFYGKEEKVVAFYLTRVLLALFCAAAEVFFYNGVKKHFGNHVARVMLFSLAFSSGMFISAAAFLPSSFAMVMIMFAYGGWFIGDYSIAIFFTAMAALVGWPFSALLGIPIAWDLVLKRKRFVYFIQWTVISFVSILCPLLYFDSHYYGKTVFTPFNIILYNVFGKGGPSLYGTEPWTFYFINGFLNFNVVFILALVSLPLFMLTEVYASKITGRNVSMPPRVLLCLVGLNLWILVFFTRPHKEERFLFPVYPLICLAGAIALSSLQNAYRFLCDRIKLVLFDSNWIALGILIVFAVLSVSRSLALYIGYHAPLDIYIELNHINNNNNIPNNIRSSSVNLCVGKEWYRYPSSFFLPDRWKLKFIRSEFRAQLPMQYSPYANATKTIPSDMNDLNKEEKSRYVPISSCHFLVDLVTYRETKLEPNYAKQTDKWEIIIAKPFLDASRSPTLFRAFYVPFLSSQHNVYGNYTLLKSKSWKNVKKKTKSVHAAHYDLNDPEEFEGIDNGNDVDG